MIIGQFHIERVTVLKPKTDPPLIVDRNGKLTFSIPTQFVESIARWDSEIFQSSSEVDELESSHGSSLDIGRKLSRFPRFEQLLRGPVRERLNHD